MQAMSKTHLLSKWKIIFGIILYIVLGELFKDILIFPVIEPYILSRFEPDLAERLSECSEYLLLGAILIPVAIFFIINPVNKSNKALIELNNLAEEKNRELNKALMEINTLKGILPICSYCKEIRNDKGYWVRLENYIQENTYAEFSHSICNDCLEKHFPEEDEEEEDLV